MSLAGKRVGFLGAGNMGEALIRGLLGAGLVEPGAIAASDVRADHLEALSRRHGVRAMTDNVALVSASDVIVLAVKPQTLPSALQEVAGVLDERRLVISIAAGVPTTAIRAHLPRARRVIRVMPNTPALVLAGAAAIARAAGLEPGDLETAETLFGAVGRVVVLEEDHMDAVTGLSGSGPAYVAMVVEALADGGVRMGLDRATALILAAQTVLGSARLILETGAHPGQVKDSVASPGGTTIAGIAALEAAGLRHALINAVERATLRSRELGQGR